MSIEAVFFDQDNTLFNSAEVAPEAYDQAFRFISSESGVSIQKIRNSWLNTLETIRCSSKPEERFFDFSLRIALENLGIDTNLTDLGVDVFHKALSNSIELTRGSREFFEQNLDIKKILFTEDETEQSEMKLRKHDLKKEFNFIVRAKDTGVMKPDISYLQKAWKALDLDPQKCVYVGDNWEKDCMLGQKHGGIGVVFGEEEERADYSIFDMMDLLPIISSE
ncbi:HAD-IA family hydrolase [Candidatus Dojkabacteria bacterium]|nr:HAD-IA family hydrolase [Candidatus Dojkabacteria bacterium]